MSINTMRTIPESLVSLDGNTYFMVAHGSSAGGIATESQEIQPGSGNFQPARTGPGGFDPLPSAALVIPIMPVLPNVCANTALICCVSCT